MTPKYEPGSIVYRHKDLSGLFWAKGQVKEVRVVRGYMNPHFIYTVLWDGEAAPKSGYLESSLFPRKDDVFHET